MRNVRLAALALVALTLGCQPSGCGNTTPLAEAPAVSPATDDLGRTVPLTKVPLRIVSLSPAGTEILFAIGAGQRVVAGTEFDTHPEEAKRLPRIGGFTPQSINVEAIVSHRPDLVVAAPQKDVIAALEKLKIPVVVLDPKGVNDVWRNMELLGKLTGCQEKATQVANDGRLRWVNTGRDTPPAKPHPRVLFVLADEPLITSGDGTFIHEIILAAGGSNAFTDVKESWPNVSDEQVLARGADVILCVEHTGGDGGGVPGRLKKRPGWDKLDAVKNGKVYAVNADLITRPGPRLVDGLEAVQKLLR